MALFRTSGGAGKEFTTATYTAPISLPHTVSDCKKGDVLCLTYSGSAGITVTNGTILVQDTTQASTVGLAVVCDSDGSVVFNGNGSVSGRLFHVK